MFLFDVYKPSATHPEPGFSVLIHAARASFPSDIDQSGWPKCRSVEGIRRNTMKFRATEGLRGWLAWTVVLSHLAYASGIYAKGWGPVLGRAGTVSVMV